MSLVTLSSVAAMARTPNAMIDIDPRHQTVAGTIATLPCLAKRHVHVTRHQTLPHPQNWIRVLYFPSDPPPWVLEAPTPRHPQQRD